MRMELNLQSICKLGQMKAREEMKFFKEAGLSTNYPSDLPWNFTNDNFRNKLSNTFKIAK